MKMRSILEHMEGSGPIFLNAYSSFTSGCLHYNNVTRLEKKKGAHFF